MECYISTILFEIILVTYSKNTATKSRLAAAADRDNGIDTGRVLLAFLDGGACGKDDELIAAYIERALERTKAIGFDIRICHFRKLQSPFSDIAIQHDDVPY